MSAFSEAWLVGPSSTNFYTRTYVGEAPNSVLIYLHGAGEHIGRYDETHALFAQRGVAVFTFDQRGFGLTAQDEEHRSANSSYGKANWREQMEDIEWAVKHVRSEFPNLPIFLMGFSLGGTAVLGFATREDAPPEQSTVALLSGIIGFAPTVQLVHLPPKLVYLIAKLIRWIMPHALYPIRNKPKDLSRNPKTNAAYLQDPLVGTPGSLEYIGDGIDYGQDLLNKDYKRWPENLPILFVHGSADTVASPVKTEEFYHKIPATDKKLVIYPGAYHELHNEPDGVKEKVLEDILAFIDSHSQPRQ
ncbi:lysophospholipase [Sparassis crispa]|uniref:Lysophospholipase n=1 Tax=Sparassis crispa TaxID=139825 RepID=A0A401H674_9APHY|nr:lysophospholipase [Sparassis crispa]GBE89889.1 lysophospholipase [Sparassis crispa]